MSPRIERILETALYVDETERSAAFYERVLGLTRMSGGERLVALDAGGGSVLLLFQRGAASTGASFEGGWIPPHEATGPAHFAFAIRAEEIEPWRRRLRAEGVAIESEVTWGRGGVSLYFRDPDGHSVELAAPGVWPVW